MPKDFSPANILPAEPTAPAWWFVFQSGRLLVSEEIHDGATAARPPLAADPGQAGLDVTGRLYLGILEGVPCFAATLAEGAAVPPGLAPWDLRRLYPAMSESRWAVAGRALQIVEWERTSRFCGACGQPMSDLPGERARKCPACGFTKYPRLSPAIIVAVRRDDELLMARSPHFPPGMMSVIAGFVEPGETLEEAVAREVFEETGVRVRDVRYFGSQSWPFPNSLMIGFTAEYEAGELRPNPSEIEAAGWFRPQGLPKLPSPMSISRRLIDDFLSRAARTE